MKRDAANIAAREVSVVIPTYNRRDLAAQAVRSALHLSDFCDVEVIIIDDQSSDNTVDLLLREFHGQLEEGLVKLVCNAENMGVTGAKNVGAQRSTGEWIIFLDSDDVLGKESLQAVVQELREASDAPAVFFRCIDSMSGGLIGKYEPSRRSIDLRAMLNHWVWGECLPAVRRGAFMQFPYDADLRGFEGLSYCRIVRAFGPARLSTVVARMYRTVGHDRLSSRTGLRARSCELARGHWRMLREFAGTVGVGGAAMRLTKACPYAMKCLSFRKAARS